MKIIITESQADRIKELVFLYLDGFEWKVEDYKFDEMTRLYIKGKDQHPEDAQFEAYTESDDDKTYRRLLVNNKLLGTIRRLFGLKWSELWRILEDWYKNKTGEQIDAVDSF